MSRTPRLALAAALATFAGACQYLPGRSGDTGGDGAPTNARQQPSAAPVSTPAAASAPAAGYGRPARSEPPARQEPARPVPTPTPRPRVVVVPADTPLKIELETAVSSGSNHTGDLVLARLSEPVRVDGEVALPSGSEVRGRVTAVVKSGRVKGRARLAVAFDTIEVRDKRHDIEATSIDVTAGSTRKRDAALIGGGAVAGAVIDGKKGAGIGALLGGGAVLVTKGKEVTLPAGTPVTLTLKSDLRVE